MLRLLNGSSFQTLVPQNPNPTPLIRSVSGTAKGKGKLKDGQPLKRSTITRKKPAGAGGGGGGRGRGNHETIERLNRMVDSCLDAPTPIRHLTAKQRNREIESEKLGLISKDRQREIDEAKKPKADPGPFVMGTPGLDLISLGLVDADKIPKCELRIEDGRRLAKEYSRILMRKHRARQAAETNLLKMKKDAIEALPEKLREKALVPDLMLFPANRFMATLTPPIKGYIDKVREAAKRNSGKEKLR